LARSRTLLNIKVIGQRTRSHGFFCISRVHDTARTSWSGFTKCYSLDGTTLLLPAEATWTTSGQYLVLSNSI